MASIQVEAHSDNGMPEPREGSSAKCVCRDSSQNNVISLEEQSDQMFTLALKSTKPQQLEGNFQGNTGQLLCNKYLEKISSSSQYNCTSQLLL